MRFRFDEDQEALRSLAAKIIGDHADPDRLGAVEQGPEPFDRDLWSALAQAGLLAAGLDDPLGGGAGIIGTCLVLQELGRAVAAVPAWTSACVAGHTIERYGPPGMRSEILPSLADGTSIVAAALEEAFQFDVTWPGTTCRELPDGWQLDGTKVAVPYAGFADRFLVTATATTTATDRTAELFLVGADSPGLSVQPGVATTGQPVGSIVLDGVRVSPDDRLEGGAAFAHQVALAGLAATAAGVIEGGLAVTAAYIGQRHQFGRPIASFQGPAIRIADAYIDAQAVWMAAWSAIWKLDAGRPADEALSIAKFWVADGGQRAAHAFQHLHGGIGLDTAYPIHRYFTWAKYLETTLGGASVQLDRLGAELAAAAPAEGRR